MVARRLMPATTALLSSLLLAVPLVAPEAHGQGPDRQAPHLEVQADWVVGAQVGRSNQPGQECAPDIYTDIPYRVSWTARDPSGIRGYNIWELSRGGPPAVLYDWWSNYGGPHDTAFRATATDNHGDCGGGSQVKAGWAVTAYDMAGNARYEEAQVSPYVVQEDGTTASFMIGAPTIARSHGWEPALCTCVSGGRLIHTSTKGATVTITIEDMSRIALIMTKAPQRGEVRISVDGVAVATVDSQAGETRRRVVVWSRSLGPGEHVVEVVNRATPGRARVDVDALIVQH